MATVRTISPECEANWINGLRQGDVRAFREMFELYTPELRRFAAINVPRDVAEDIVQDVFFRLWTRRLELTLVPGELTKYLFGAVRKQVLQQLRHQRVRDQHASTVSEMANVTQVIRSPDAELLAEDLERGVQQVLATLSPVQREVITLRWTQGMAYTDIASILGISPAAAMQQVSRIRRLLHPVLVRFFPEFQ